MDDLTRTLVGHPRRPGEARLLEVFDDVSAAALATWPGRSSVAPPPSVLHRASLGDEPPSEFSEPSNSSGHAGGYLRQC